MKIVIVGWGVQGEKRHRVAGSDVVALVDPIKVGADYRHIQEVPLAMFDAALVCVPDAAKEEIVTYLLENGKHVLVEKPLWAPDLATLEYWERLAKEKQLVCYTAYNHRFEPHWVKMRHWIHSGELGRIYHCRLFYGNGTARIVRQSWRDQGAGVLTDLAPHLLDVMDFWFGSRDEHYRIATARCFENQAADHVIVINQDTEPQIALEMTLLSWRNEFTCDVLGEKGSAHIRSLCKWGPSEWVMRKRIFPSGRPLEESMTVIQPDPTWALEYAHFNYLVSHRVVTDLSRDRWIYRLLAALGARVMEMNETCQIR
ncbi:MAG: oxidoreductase [Coxiella sp. RIFCSPHIGHO2_12_FULL_44_14]|nr:MAG: oxidoreductase [Coxiella sp. RIFCSPHIGHO2_12_FULL_44_14]